MKKVKRLLSAVLLGILLLMTLVVVGCYGVPVVRTPVDPVGPDDPPGPENPVVLPKLSSVVASGVEVSETASSLVVTWLPVENATSYLLYVTKSNSQIPTVATVRQNTVNLRNLTNFIMPASGTINVRITAQADGYTDSEPVTITYELEGALLLSPQITSFENDILKWNSIDGASSYTVKIDGKATESAAPQVDLKSVTGTSTIEISAKIGDKQGAVTSVMYDAAAKQLTAMPISNYTVDGDILRWGEVNGAIGYKVVDLDMNSYTVTASHYIMSIRNIVYGVYPVMPAGSVVKNCVVSPTDIKYLSGKGTSSDPYLIKTPFDLRTIDYYELRYAENGAKGARNVYRIAEDMDYNSVRALESDSNVFTLRKPFYGELDGNGKTLSNLRVNYKYGFWALFENIVKGATVKDITFDKPEITNEAQDDTHPINPMIATVAYMNSGTISGVTVKNARYKATAGSIAGIASHNRGTVQNCTITACTFTENKTSSSGAAAYEMAGVVLENLNGGKVGGCSVGQLTVSGTGTNLSTTGGIVSVNRKGGVVTDNSFNGVTVTGIRSGKEVGGVVGYCENGGTVTKGSGTLGTLTVGTAITAENGSGSRWYGKLCGKKD